MAEQYFKATFDNLDDFKSELYNKIFYPLGNLLVLLNSAKYSQLDKVTDSAQVGLENLDDGTIAKLDEAYEKISSGADVLSDLMG